LLVLFISKKLIHSATFVIIWWGLVKHMIRFKNGSFWPQSNDIYWSFAGFMSEIEGQSCIFSTIFYQKNLFWKFLSCLFFYQNGKKAVKQWSLNLNKILQLLCKSLIIVVIIMWTVKFDFVLMLEHDIRGILTWTV